MAGALYLPFCLLKMVMIKQWKEWMPQPKHEPETAAIVANYFSIALQRQSKQEVITMNTCRYFCYPYHSLSEKDRLMNPEIDYPIAFAFGDRDFFGSEGAEDIVRNNRHFNSGRSQIFKVEDSGHAVMIDNPE